MFGTCHLVFSSRITKILSLNSPLHVPSLHSQRRGLRSWLKKKLVLHLKLRNVGSVNCKMFVKEKMDGAMLKLAKQVLIEPECLMCEADPHDRMCRECASKTKNWSLYWANLRKLEVKQ